jgi:hypothetical protein
MPVCIGAGCLQPLRRGMPSMTAAYSLMVNLEAPFTVSKSPLYGVFKRRAIGSGLGVQKSLSALGLPETRLTQLVIVAAL